ncbi:MAG: M23 family metallopeptidase [Candidatus Pacebacteria bacterium]|nr:M23 family metallopeptidase [Candidatus Paceibacterota bacterium]
MKHIISFLFLCFLSTGTHAEPDPPRVAAKLLHFETKLLDQVLVVLDTVLSTPGNSVREFAVPYNAIVNYLHKGENREEAFLASVDICLSVDTGTNMGHIMNLFEKANAEYEYVMLCSDTGCHDEKIEALARFLYSVEIEEASPGVILFDKTGITLAFGDGELSSLVKNGILTDKYGNRPIHPVTGKSDVFHAGIDIGVPMGTEITAPFSGFITKVQNSKYGFGNMIIIQNQCWPLHMLLGHLNSISVTEGQFVEAGAVIGTSGRSGVTSGPCLHIGAYWQNKLINPLTMFGDKKMSKYSPFDGASKNNQLYIGKVLQKEAGRVMLVKF